MRKIQMVDLTTQYQKIQEEIDQAIANVIHSASFINGPEVKKFSHNLATYLDVSHVIPCANGTDALQIALMALGLKAGDEVITSPFTFVATAEVIALLGLKPVFVDIHPDTFNLDESKLEHAINARTKCIIPVHLFGQSCEMKTIMDIARQHDIRVIEDNAQATGASYLLNGKWIKSGTIGDFGCTSFYPSKNLSTFGDAGALFTHDAELAEKARIICNHGSGRRYYYDEIGVNSRLDSIQAAILNIKLRYLDEYNKKRQIAATRYDQGLAANPMIEIPYRAKYAQHVFHQYTILVKKDRNLLQEFLAQNNIPSMIYYPVPLHLSKAYKKFGFNVGDFPVSESLAKEVLSLPMHTELDEEQQMFIIDKVMNFFTKSQKK